MKEIDPESTRQNPLSPASTGSPASVVKDINRSQMGTVMGNTSVMGNASAMGSVIRPLEKSQNHKPHEELSDSVTKSLFGNNLFSDAPSPQQVVTQVKERGVGDIKILYKGHVPPSPPETPAPAPQPPFVAAASPKNNNNNNRRGDGNDNNREKGGENQQQQQRNVKPQKQPSHHTQPVQKDAPILPPANITAVEPPPPQHAPTNRQPQQPGGNGKVENEMECGQESLASSDSDDSIASYTISKSLEDILDALTPSPGFEKFYFRPRNLHLHDPRYTYVSSEEEFSDGPFESAVDVGESSEFSINAGNSWEGHDDLLLNEDYSNGIDNLTINDDHLMRSEDSNVDVHDDVFAGETGIDIVESLELSINALTVDEGPSSMNRRGGCGGGEGPLSMNGRGGGRGGGGGGGGEGPSSMNGRGGGGGGGGGGGEGPSSMNGRGGGCGGGGEEPSSMNGRGGGRGGGGGVEAQPGARKIRANRSPFWDFVYESEEGWKCVYCHKVIEIGKSRTDHISSHLQKAHNWPKEKIRELKKRKNDERSISTAPPIKKQKKQVVQSLPTKTGAVDATDDEVLAGGEEEEGEGGWDVHDDVELPAYIDPAISIQLDELNQSLQACYRLTTEGKFSDAIKELRQILLEVLRVASWQKIAQARQLVEICRKYLVGLLMEVKRQALNANSEAEKIRSLELAAYFTHCDLQPPHKILTLRTAVKLSHGLQQLKLCASFAQRCIELGPEPDVAQTMRKYLAACDKNLNDKHEINYDEHDPFVVCSKTFMPLYQGNPQSKCSFCGASFDPKFIGEVCDVCQIFEIGGDVIGLEISTAESGR